MNIDTTITYDYKEYPDTKAGRCDNCDYSHFFNKIVKGKLIRECRNCGMKKSI